MFAAAGGRLGLGLGVSATARMSGTSPLQHLLSRSSGRLAFGPSRQSSPSSFFSSACAPRRQAHSFTLNAARAQAGGAGGSGAAQAGRLNVGLIAGGSLIAALAASNWRQPAIACEGLAFSRPYASGNTMPTLDQSAAPESMVDFYQLGFGTICGVCAGIFIKKGLKLIAFMLGGTYVLMQYFSSQRWISINWGAISNKYEKFVDTAPGPSDPAGNALTNSRAARVWQRLVHFLTADFQQRATFTAGLVLGFRLG